ncbi:putative adhesin [Winogradskyella algicola]|jgi:hypothetical protein|uniref:putative adhesin n=1 Tax=Winogradskyella algicola TaxID=2575815 RepID=UPI001109DD88|nr:hypothetical protein [Winogradskyella algicola]
MSVKVTNKDIVLLGHGNYAGGVNNMVLPEKVDLYILPPIGYTLKTDVAKALIQQNEIDKLVLHHDNGRGDSTIKPPMILYKGGTEAPNLKLYDLEDLYDWGRYIIGNRKNVVTVNKPTLLSDLLADNNKIQEAIWYLAEGEQLKLYWSACANQIGGNSASLQ